MGRKKKAVIEEIEEVLEEETIDELSEGGEHEEFEKARKAKKAVDLDDIEDDEPEDTEDLDDEEFQEDHDIELPPKTKKKIKNLIEKPWTPSIRKGIPIPPRTRTGKWQAIAKALEPGDCIDNVESRKQAIGIASAIKSNGGTAKFRQLSNGSFAVWRMS